MMVRRVAVTGVGCVSALGNTAEDLWEACRSGRSGIGPLQSVPHDKIRFKNAAEARQFLPSQHFDEKQLMALDRFAQFAIAAAREALAQSAPQLTAEELDGAAVVTGSCYGGKSTEDAGFYSLYAEKQQRLSPMTIPRLMANAGASALCMELGWRGPAWTVSTACSSASHAIGQAFWMVRHGLAPVALAGGSEAPFTYGSLKAWEALRVVSQETCRPFSAGRGGMILGEGAGMLVLEPLDRAVARGATVLAEIIGFGMSSDAHHLTQPSAEGAARTIRSALTDAGVAGEEVGVVNAHGTGTLANDAAESIAIRSVFPHQPWVTGTKSLHGHALGASGAMEAVATVLGLARQGVPATANFTGPDPECTVRLATAYQQCAHRVAVSNSFAFGGLNAVLVFRRAEA